MRGPRASATRAAYPIYLHAVWSCRLVPLLSFSTSEVSHIYRCARRGGVTQSRPREIESALFWAQDVKTRSILALWWTIPWRYYMSGLMISCRRPMDSVPFAFDDYCCRLWPCSIDLRLDWLIWLHALVHWLALGGDHGSVFLISSSTASILDMSVRRHMLPAESRRKRGETCA
jgi:hypothetical protein